MKTQALIAALGFAFFGAAQAGSLDAPKSRDDVRAETLRAVSRGELNQFGEGRGNVEPLAGVASSRSRADVERDTVASIARGEVSYGEADARRPADFVSTRTRAEVRAEAAAALANGTLLSQGQFTQG